MSIPIKIKRKADGSIDNITFCPTVTIEKQVWESTLNRSMVLEAQNAELKELLKECKNKADEALQAIQKDCESDDWSIFHYPEVQYFYNNLEDKIDEVLK